MALQKIYIEDTGASFPTAYFKVITIILDYLQKSASIVVGVYVDKQSRDNNKTIVKRITYTLVDRKELQTTNNGEQDVTEEIEVNDFSDNFKISNLQTQDPVKVAYEYLKTLHEYEGAIDC